MGPTLREQFDDAGYVIVPSVLTSEQVAQLRSEVEARFDAPLSDRPAGDSDGFVFDLFNRYSEFSWVLFLPSVLDALREVTGDPPVLLRESVAQREQYGHWHKDTTSAERAGERFPLADDLRFAELAFYLQDNDAEFAGGLEVAPRSHRADDEFARRGVVDRALGKLRGGPRQPDEVVPVPSRAGDLVIFDFRLSHRATRPKVPRGSRPDKLALFQAVSSRSSHVDAYHRYLTGRPGYDYLEGYRWGEDLTRSAEEAGLLLG